MALGRGLRHPSWVKLGSSATASAGHRFLVNIGSLVSAQQISALPPVLPALKIKNFLARKAGCPRLAQLHVASLNSPHLPANFGVRQRKAEGSSPFSHVPLPSRTSSVHDPVVQI